MKAKGKAKAVELTVTPKDKVSERFKAALADVDEVVSVEWTHRHYLQNDEYIPFGDDIEAFLKREITKPVIRWKETEKDGKSILGYELLPSKYFFCHKSLTPSKELLAEFWRLEKVAEDKLKGLASV